MTCYRYNMIIGMVDTIPIIILYYYVPTNHNNLSLSLFILYYIVTICLSNVNKQMKLYKQEKE